jgi:hypothetical protein
MVNVLGTASVGSHQLYDCVWVYLALLAWISLLRLDPRSLLHVEGGACTVGG